MFESPKDKIVFDVSHQSYVHKMLTGRINAFINPDEYDSVTGYTNPNESEHDFFTIGHTSTAVSLAGGLALGRDLTGGSGNVIAVVGDGSLSGGEAFEGLDFGATLDSNFIVIVNDNDMSIAENHGGLYDNLKLLRDTDGNAECNYFKSLGYDYHYVAYGNDLKSLINAFRMVKDTDHPVIVHINTQKGKGYAPAEAHKEQFHYGAPFDKATGHSLYMDASEDYSDVFAAYMLELMKKRSDVSVITAGTPAVLGFRPEQRKQAGRQFIDVGIAEQEAVALASGLAKAGTRPCFGVVSSFVQRAYDQLSQDVAINDTPAVVNIFYGGIVGMTDVTHLGWFDIALISNIPGWVYLAPTCKQEYLAMLDWAMKQTRYPVAIRIPAMGVVNSDKVFPADYSNLNRYQIANKGKDVAIIAAGAFFGIGQQAAGLLRDKGYDATLINPRYLSGIDTGLLDQLKADHQLVITLEDGVLDGGFGEKIARYYGTSDMKVRCYGIPKQFLDRY
ncbi:MAG: 1-deoxy-D-xylulose-5-phosphate synthase, partial [Muribaculaceae bacterium]|nr:1-deoxy-D-xylulose-5-phosphate synthase [Muribaculaceae bacterium]